MDGTLHAVELIGGIDWMSPHKQDPAFRKVEVDLSEILIRPEEVEREQVQSGNALLDWTDWSLDVGTTGISLFGLANISFLLGSCLIGLICAHSFDTSNIRGEGHIDRKTLSVRGQNLILHDHNVSVWNLLPGPSQVAYFKQSPTFSTIVPFGEDQSPALSPSVGGVADRASTDASSPLRSDTDAPEQGSRTMAASVENVSSNEQTTSKHSSRRVVTRGARKPIITSRADFSSWRNFQRSWARGLRSSKAANSPSGTTRKTVSSAKVTHSTGRRLGPRFRT